jgi:hypothetical protein
MTAHTHVATEATPRRGLGQIDDATARALVLHFGLKGAIDYATKIFQMGGPLAKEYGWLADYLTTYKAATEVGRWPKEFDGGDV